jgi:GNAT superfamily N-acetyltransferase
MPSSDVVVRLAEPGDAPHLQAYCFSMNTVAEVEAEIVANQTAFQAGRCVQLVAMVDSTPVANILLRRDDHPLRAHRATLYALVVSEHYQHRGIARRLLHEACAYARTMHITILETSCRGGELAEVIYPRLGFREYGRLPAGLIEPWGARRCFDEVYFYLPVTSADHTEGLEQVHK